MKKIDSIKHRRIFMLVIISMLITALLSACSPEEDEPDDEDPITYFGTVVPCGKDNGYKPNTESGWNPWSALTIPGLVMGLVPDSNPHNGWSLGSFFVEGYSATTSSTINCYSQSMPVYLKNAGDTVSFGFKLDQNINQLNGNASLVIADDHKVIQGCWVEDPYVPGDFNHGVLIIVHTDYQGNETITTYRDFLKGKSVGANTEVQLFEEGDYRVILCYEIYKKTGFNFITDWMDPNGSWFDYRMESYFSIRNGNSMVYPFDLETGSELTNGSYAKDGFRVDLANSRYLQLSVKKENLNQFGDDIVEDTRFNKAVSDGAVFTEEGKYTITVTNPYTGSVTDKVIYVGKNAIMRCHAVTGLPISTINARLASGYTMNSDGSLQDPPNSENGWAIVAAVGGSVVAVAGIIIIIRKKVSR